MSDERITDATGSLPDPQDDPTAALLREVLTREADAVRPAPDGLTRIRAAIEADGSRSGVRGLLPLTGRRGGARPGGAGAGMRRWGPVLAAAASVLLLAGVAGVALDRFPIFDVRGDGAASAPPQGPPRLLPVYAVGELTAGGRTEYALFREYRPTTARSLDERLGAALTEAVSRPAQDPDYVRVFGGSGGTRVGARWDAAAGEVVVELTPAMVTVRRAGDVRAQIAIQQLVWTATAVLSEVRADSADVPVRISISGPTRSPYMFGRPTYLLGGQFHRAHGADDPLAPVWIVDPAEQTTLGRAATKVDLSVGYSGRTGVTWVLERDGQVASDGTVQPVWRDGAQNAVPGSRGTATFEIDTREPGQYVLTVSEPPTEAAPRWQDSKAFTVN
jgi:hypothetical protein